MEGLGNRASVTTANPFAAVARDLREVVGASVRLLERLTDEEAARPWRAGKWTRKEIIGHLLDSASNNHQRFVRGTLNRGVTGPGYEQNGWVALQRPNDVAWKTLVAFWKLYNRYLAHVLSQLPAEAANYPCVVGDAAPATLLFIAEDYVAHMKHHLNQVVGEHFENSYDAKIAKAAKDQAV